MAFATLEDYELRTRTEYTSPEDIAYIETLLDDASAYLQAKLDKCEVEVDPTDEVQMANLKVVCCNLVNRRVSSEGVDYTQSTMTAGSYSQSFTYANPSGDFYLSSSERDVLGLPRIRQKFWSIEPRIGGGDD